MGQPRPAPRFAHQGKKHTKSEKLDLILSELSELKGEKKPLKDRAV
jgi:hypothetical protein